MSRENVEIVRSVYEAVNRDDWDAAFAASAPDVELTTPPGPNAGTFRGREEIQGFWEEMGTPFETWTVEPEEFFERGDQVALVLRIRAQPKGWGAKNTSSARSSPERDTEPSTPTTGETSRRSSSFSTRWWRPTP